MNYSEKLKYRLKESYGPWALVTGASSGIGRALAEKLAEAGFHIVLTGRNKDGLQAFGNRLEEDFGSITEVVVADLSTTAGINWLLEEVEDIPIGLFVACAGFGTSGYFLRSEVEKETEMLEVNARAVMELTHYFGRKFAGHRKGGIILMSSIVGFQGTPYAANYAATKAYVQSLGEALYHELKPYDVDVLTAAPGPVHSNFASVADMVMGKALEPSDVAVPILKALGKKSVVFPGRLTKILLFGLRTVPRWGKVRIMQKVMSGMTQHQ